MYVSVKEETEERLYLVREPSPRSWAVCVGIIALGLGASFYSSDNILWQSVLVLGSAFMAVTCLEEWEYCLLDKKSGNVTLSSFSLIQRMLKPAEEQKKVVTDIHEVSGVTVEENGDHGYHVILVFSNGLRLGVTETCTVGDSGEHQLVAEKIRKFLKLDEQTDQPRSPSPSSFSQLSSIPASDSFPESLNGEDNQSTASDESFEQIDKAELSGEAMKESPASST